MMRSGGAGGAGLVVMVLAVVAGAAQASYCTGGPSPHSVPNLLAVNDAQPQHLRSTRNGHLYTAGMHDTMNTSFYVAHVYGSYYDMGYAHGELLRAEARSFITGVFELIVEGMFKGDEAKAVAALDAVVNATKPHTLPSVFEEMKGLADATGLQFDLILRMHVYPELAGGHCSMLGAWGSATPDGKLVQLRALDYSTEAPFRNHPAVIVYHPSGTAAGPGTKGQTPHAWANVGFTGWLGSITGYSSAEITVSEIGVSNPDGTFGAQSTDGTPFSFLLRDVLQFDGTLEDAVGRIKDAARTCDLILGVGDGKPEAAADKPFRGFQVSHSVCNVFTDTNMMPRNDTWHARIEDVVYWGMDWLCPGWSGRLMQQLQYLHGNITAEAVVHEVVSLVQTGNLHVAVYDPARSTMFVSFHAPDGADPSVPQHAYERPFTKLDMTALFGVGLDQP